MNKIPLEAGRVVRSTAGRDGGRLFVVIAEVDQDFVLVADGSLRKIDRPKKKRRKHLYALPQLMPSIVNQMPEDHQIRNYIRANVPNEEG